MVSKRLGSRIAITTVVLLTAVARYAAAEIALGEGNKLKVYGDMRFRVESDWDSMQSNGTKREDRDQEGLPRPLGTTATRNAVSLC